MPTSCPVPSLQVINWPPNETHRIQWATGGGNQRVVTGNNGEPLICFGGEWVFVSPFPALETPTRRASLPPRADRRVAIIPRIDSLGHPRGTNKSTESQCLWSHHLLKWSSLWRPLEFRFVFFRSDVSTSPTGAGTRFPLLDKCPISQSIGGGFVPPLSVCGCPVAIRCPQTPRNCFGWNSGHSSEWPWLWVRGFWGFHSGVFACAPWVFLLCVVCVDGDAVGEGR